MSEQTDELRAEYDQRIGVLRGKIASVARTAQAQGRAAAHGAGSEEDAAAAATRQPARIRILPNWLRRLFD